MKHIIYEGLKLAEKQKTLSLLLVIIISLMLIMTECAYVGFSADSISTKTIDQIEQNQTLYRIADDAEDISQYLHSISELNNLKNFYNQLEDNEYFEYFECINQPVYVNTKDHSFSEFNLESNAVSIAGKDHYKLKNFFVNMNYIQHILDLSLYDGAIFDNEDMFCSDVTNIVPLIVGYNYKELLNVNDTLLIHHIGINFNCKVIGIMNENSYAPIGNKMVSLDDYLLLPSFEFPNSPATSDELYMQSAFYLQKINGYIQLKNGYSIEAAFKYIEKSLTQNGIYFDIDVVNSDDYMDIEIVKSFLYTNCEQTMTIFIIFIFLICYLVLNLEKCIITNNMELFDLMKTLGYTKAHIKLCQIAHTIINTFPALIITLIINIIFNFY